MSNGRSPGKPKLSSKHPIAALEKRIIDADPFADCRPSSIVVLVLFARNLEKGRNGHTFVSQEDAARHGVEKKTFYRALIELQAHGFIFPTSRGGHGRCGTYALTWLPLSKDTSGLQVDNFKSCAWRDWMPSPEKKRGGKMSPRSSQESPQPIKLVVKNPPSLGDKNPPLEVNTNIFIKEGAAVDLVVDLDPALKGEKAGAHPEKPAARNDAAKPATPPICQHADCETIVTLGRAFCRKHRHLESADAEAAR